MLTGYGQVPTQPKVVDITLWFQSDFVGVCGCPTYFLRGICGRVLEAATIGLWEPTIRGVDNGDQGAGRVQIYENQVES